MPNPAPDYAELHCLSNFTFLTGASHPEELVQRAHEQGYAALALTDECSLAGVVRAHGEAKACGLKLIVGSEIRLQDGLRLVLLAADRDGYGDLCELITRGQRRAEKGRYLLERSDLGPGLDGCLVLWLPDDGVDPEPGLWLVGRFPGRVWIGVELHRSGRDRARLAALEVLGKRCGIPLVAAGGVLMHARGRRPLQDTLTAIRLGLPLARAGHGLQPNGERHLRRRDDLAELYPSRLLAETLEIAGRCSFSLDQLSYEYPLEDVPAGLSPSAWLRELTEQGLRRRWPEGAPPKVRKLLEHELGLITELGYESYFLTVHDIVGFARSRGILCQGRGSAANSVVCYALGITEVDPARMELLFERFISRERDEPPDIDVDFEHQRREEVIQYVYSKYGRERAALAATVITYRPKSAVRDVGKALGLDLDQVDRLAAGFTWWDGRRISPDRVGEAGFDPDNPLLRRVLVLTQAILGFPRHLSQHVGGFVISRGPLSRLVPIENAAMAERTVIQWDKDDLSALGLLKVDCLALGMLSAIRRAFELVNTYRGWHGETGGAGSHGPDNPLGLHNVPPEDPAVYEMIQHGDTVGVFQIESRAQMAMLPRLRPTCFYDLVIEVAIVRPGPIQGDMVHPYLKRRQGLEPVTYPSEAVRQVLGRTLGVPIFQEQVIKVAMVAAGFSPGEADRLRRSIAAWRRRGTLEQFERRLVEGMVERGYEVDFARRIYQQILGFGEYGFPESHAASFALLVYVSAWLKHHEPAAFFAAVLNSQPMGFYAPAQLVQAARRAGVAVRPVDVAHSDWDCTLETEGQDSAPVPALRLGLRMVKGLSRVGAQRLVSARAQGPFWDLDRLAHRAGLHRGDLEALAAADALRGLAGDRHRAVWQMAGVQAPLPLFEGADRAGPGDQDGLQPTTFVASRLCGSISSDAAGPVLPRPTEGQEILADYASLGLTLRRHPLALLRPQLQRRGLIPAEALRHREHGSWVCTGGLVVNRQRPSSANSVTFVTLEDETGQINLIIWKRLAERQRLTMLRARLLGVVGQVQREGEVLHLIAKRLLDYSYLLGRLPTRSRDFR
jgi:error-prone DNA polymerase